MQSRAVVRLLLIYNPTEHEKTAKQKKTVPRQETSLHGISVVVLPTEPEHDIAVDGGALQYYNRAIILKTENGCPVFFLMVEKKLDRLF